MITEILNIDLVKELGLDGVEPEQKNDLLNKFQEVLDSRISQQILLRLSGEEKIELDKILDSNEDLSNFLRSKIANFDILVAEMVAGLKKEIIDLNSLIPKK